MKKSFLYIFACVIIAAAPRVLAQTVSNSDFNPFPQMEQDMSNTNDGSAVSPEQQNSENDAWPPVNSDAQANTEAQHD